MTELRASAKGLDVALRLATRDPAREDAVLRWFQARADERLRGDVLERCGQTLEALPYTPWESL